MSLFVFFQYNEELHYVEPCLNGTLVQADVTNKDVSSFFFKWRFMFRAFTGKFEHLMVYILSQ